MITVTTNGKLVAKRLQDLGGALPKIGAGPIYRAMQQVYKRVGQYPGAPKKVKKSHKGKYERTYTLRKSRDLFKNADGNGYTLLVDPVGKHGQLYGVFVLGDITGRGQSKYNKHWTPIQIVFNEEFAKVPPEVVAALEFYVAGNQGVE